MKGALWTLMTDRGGQVVNERRGATIPENGCGEERDDPQDRAGGQSDREESRESGPWHASVKLAEACRDVKSACQRCIDEMVRSASAV